jgi:hypothetical protein
LGKKRGRPRKREAPAGVEPIAPAAWARIRQMVAAGALDPIHATEIGRLSYLGEITASQAAAGFRVAEIYGRYERSIGRRRSARSPSYEIAFGPAAEQVASEIEAVRARSAAREWARLQDLIPPYPPIAKALLEALYFNAALRNTDCKVLAGQLERVKFEKGGAREQELTYAQAVAFVRTAIEFDRKGIMPSGRALNVAIGTAVQSDLLLRQMDIIGESAAVDATHKPASRHSSSMARSGPASLLARPSPDGAGG